MKKKLSDMVFQRISPPDHKTDLSLEDLSRVLVKRLGLKRKESKARHAELLLELLKMKKDNIPLSIEKISQILQVSQSQTYEELRKWRSIGLIEFVKIPAGSGFIKGYMLPANTVNRLMDRVESSMKSFMRKTRRIAKDFDDLLMLGIARKEKVDAKTDENVEPQEISEESEEGVNEVNENVVDE
ncbi:MAG: hypothetical protein V1900_00250 [Candidatus Aenigmatarchaeota archaeon]